MERNIISEKATIGKNVQMGAFCIIEDDVVIGDNTIVKNYVELRKGTIIGSDCYIDSRVVNKSIPANEIWFGNPAKFKKRVTETEK